MLCGGGAILLLGELVRGSPLCGGYWLMSCRLPSCMRA